MGGVAQKGLLAPDAIRWGEPLPPELGSNDPGYLRAKKAAIDAFNPDMSQGIYAVERAPENDQLLSDAKPPPEGPCVDWAAEQFLADIRPKIEEAQRIALDIAPRRWLMLQRADDLTRFLNRASNNKMSPEEISQLGQAITAIEQAGYGARMKFFARLAPSEEGVPDRLSGAIAQAKMAAELGAGYAFRCRATTFLSM
mmetsp:Transcript_48155/g.108169  ORF Transcript_48155/g.108169 Transcript_48155/m.108169 type:complete len:198 (+) Transcript_48155:114-707(+)